MDTIHAPIPPLIFIPTTAGTSADVSQFAIISDQQEKVKISIVSKAVVPDVALIDPETTMTMDPFLTACTGVDAMVHAIEAFVSTGAGPLTDMHALDAIRLISTNLRPLVADPGNLALREQVMLGSMKAGWHSPMPFWGPYMPCPTVWAAGSTCPMVCVTRCCWST